MENRARIDIADVLRGISAGGSTVSFGVGLGIFALQYTFAVFWLLRNKQGLLEYLN